ncbi:hypothetical protein I6J18_04435 [Peribacillus psychrosaccharolyticus]|uniref:Uncharacterized protein n=1 Tax=Peribacillus psychrosaccharolyticus TaxID=1407 RepID=A0A974NNY7_PERPY|nr:hypothetical protein [Peribacillus psychrosaccharolyticus]MEC2057405.1 hypothetical protein [Peribacillus psychrosaccharolyticus]MED3742769.1 hypothetical protein [Peribacillus psychrosaccharolyticus]QQT01154.1 hypothetical protein I6J18_04435 [Peribacillus psychrosaccharolyticus]
MENKINLISLFDKLIEDSHGEMKFAFIRKGNTFIYTDVTSPLLEALNITRDEFVGKSVDNCSFIGDDLAVKLKEIYPAAWGGKRVVFYCVPNQRTNTFFVVTLNPQIDNNKFVEVMGNCVPLDKEEFKDTLHMLKKFKPFEIRNE